MRRGLTARRSELGLVGQVDGSIHPICALPARRGRRTPPTGRPTRCQPSSPRARISSRKSSRPVNRRHPVDTAAASQLPRPLPRRVGHRQLPTNLLRQKIRYLRVARHSLGVTVCEFSHKECSLPSRRKCRSSPSRFMRRLRVPAPRPEASSARTPRAGVRESAQSLRAGSPGIPRATCLARCSRHLRAVGDEPGTVPLDNRRELVAHAMILAPPEFRRRAAAGLVI